MKKYLIHIVLLFAAFLYSTAVEAQCAMCRTTLESNVSDGDVAVSAKLNLGILYLLATPYVLFSLLAFFWYKSSKKNGKSFNLQSYFKG